MYYQGEHRLDISLPMGNLVDNPNADILCEGLLQVLDNARRWSVGRGMGGGQGGVEGESTPEGQPEPRRLLSNPLEEQSPPRSATCRLTLLLKALTRR